MAVSVSHLERSTEVLALARIIVGAVGLMVGGFLAISSLNVLRAHTNDWPLLAIEAAVLLPIVFFALWFALFGHRPEERARIGFALGMGVIVGFIFTTTSMPISLSKNVQIFSIWSGGQLWNVESVMLREISSG